MLKPFSPAALPSLLALGALLSSCYQVPVTGRKALDLTSDTELAKVSAAAFDEVKSKHPRSKDQARIDQLQRVGGKIAKVVFWDMPNADWEFVVFDEPKQINAFAMAGGKVGVFSGLFKIANTDDELAAVIAHEIAHVTARHVHERLSQEMLAEAGNVVGAVGLMGVGAGSLTTSTIMGLYGSSASMQMLAYDRAKEKEADYIGIMYAARAGYNPEAALTVMERLEAETAGTPSPPVFASTHPPTSERITEIQAALPKALELYQKSALKPAPTVLK
ncbi:MAG: M48 family metallopeptidase [Opitutaceae bacterium]